MAKKLPKFGVNNYHKRTPKKRPGRHAKKYSKRQHTQVQLLELEVTLTQVLQDETT